MATMFTITKMLIQNKNTDIMGNICRKFNTHSCHTDSSTYTDTNEMETCCDEDQLYCRRFNKRNGEVGKCYYCLKRGFLTSMCPQEDSNGRICVKCWTSGKKLRRKHRYLGKI